MQTTKPRIKKWLGIGITLLLGALVAWMAFGKPDNNDKVLVKAETFPIGNGYGYNILADGKVYIHQEFIPSIAGRQAFHSREDAKKVADLVISRLSGGEIPTITAADLKNLGIGFDAVVVQ